MPFLKGDRLGPYEILALVGQGGMGEVYRAHDDRLRRDVAVKVSNAQFTERFALEARAIAALNHTNICHLYDVGPNYLVMEYVEGDDLEGPLDFDAALPIIQQLIDGIEAAHEKNIVHRDLKPANIKITPEGLVKILDFGLAKAMDPPLPGGSNPENSPTLTIGATAVGTILGTAAYMAPEQAMGKQADKRSDIWSFGVILHEVLTGRKLFAGETAVEILGGVLHKDADISAAPAQVHRLLRWCLEKDRKRRLASISDARRLLNEAGGTESGGQSVPPPQSRFGSVPWMVAAVMTVVAMVTLWAPWRSTPPVDRPLVRLDVDLGADVSLIPVSSVGSAAGSSVAISPDGMRLAYASGTPPKLFTRRLDQPKATAFPGTEGAAAPFFSPDGQWIGFVALGRANKVAVEGGAVTPLPLGEVGVIAGASWGEDGSILLTTEKRLVRIQGDGQPETVAALAIGEVALAFPQILPGGKAVLFSAYTAANPDASSIEVITLADHHRKTVSRGGTSPRYLATSNGEGHLVYINKATLFAVPFDLDTLETRGTALPIVDDVAFNGAQGAAQLSFSRTGTLVYRRSGEETGLLTVAWLDGAGKMLPLLAKPGIYARPNVSPDGQRVVLEVTEGPGPDIWTYDWQRDTMTRVTFTGKAESAVWSPDGRYIVFRAIGEGMSVTRSDGAGKPQPLTQSSNNQYPSSFTPDGKRLAFNEIDPKTRFDIWTVPLESDGAGLRAGTPELFLQTSTSERSPAFSPDGQWLTYSSDESGTHEVYVRAFPDKGGKWQISKSGGIYPMWSRNGHELLFEAPDRKIMAAAYTMKGDSFAADKSRVWSDRQLGGPSQIRNVDISPDGKRIAALMAAPESRATQQAQNHVAFLENFFDELRRKLPTGK